jgi:hypothetical protein
MAEFLGYLLAAGWYGIGLMGSHAFVHKGYTISVGSYLWGAMLGPIQFLLAMIAPRR